MPRKRRRNVVAGLGTLAGGLLLVSTALAQGPIPAPTPQAPAAPLLTIDQLLRMDRTALDRLYQQASAAPIPSGKVRGRAILFPGTALAVPSSKVARLCWQGKVFAPCGQTVVNRFFGVRMIRGDVAYGESWMDGRPSLIIDYSRTSFVYARNRDEIRQVAPGLYLGLMYARTCPQPRLSMYFALEIPPGPCSACPPAAGSSWGQGETPL